MSSVKKVAVPSCMFHSLTVLSPEVETRSRPSGEKVRERISWMCPWKVFRTCFVFISQIWREGEGGINDLGENGLNEREVLIH